MAASLNATMGTMEHDPVKEHQDIGGLRRFQAGDLIRYRTWMPDYTFIEATVESVYQVGQLPMLKLSNGVRIAALNCETS